MGETVLIVEGLQLMKVEGKKEGKHQAPSAALSSLKDEFPPCGMQYVHALIQNRN